jgi:hypothetical protein
MPSSPMALVSMTLVAWSAGDESRLMRIQGLSSGVTHEYQGLHPKGSRYATPGKSGTLICDTLISLYFIVEYPHSLLYKKAA